MGVAEGEPEALVAGGRADDRQHVGRAGAHAHPGFRIEALAEREQRLRDGLGALELHRRLRRVAVGELGAGGQADAAAIGASEIAALASRTEWLSTALPSGG